MKVELVRNTMVCGDGLPEGTVLDSWALVEQQRERGVETDEPKMRMMLRSLVLMGKAKEYTAPAPIAPQPPKSEGPTEKLEREDDKAEPESDTGDGAEPKGPAMVSDAEKGEALVQRGKAARKKG